MAKMQEKASLSFNKLKITQMQ
uniref:Uncharacterized protein n=1 Tax=Rhizophora mucronata TaxID=61149 RepID=A0A2P2Q5T5_RHIMU